MLEADLSERLLREAAGDDIFRLRSDAVKAAHALQLVAAPVAVATRRTGFGTRLSIASIVGLVVGLLLALVLLHTLWAPSIQCHSFSNGGYVCTRGGR